MRGLNLGCGTNLITDEGWENVDKFKSADGVLVWDLENLEWPWQDNCANTVLFNHSLEHMGQSPDDFIHVVRELYRVCVPNAEVHIHYPHHRSDDFWGDPTHVRALTTGTFELFSKEINRKVKELGAANSPLGLIHDVDFEIKSIQYILDDRFSYLQNEPTWERVSASMSNVIREVRVILRVVKDAVQESL